MSSEVEEPVEITYAVHAAFAYLEAMADCLIEKEIISEVDRRKFIKTAIARLNTNRGSSAAGAALILKRLVVEH